jgi:hypothetical protein
MAEPDDLDALINRLSKRYGGDDLGRLDRDRKDAVEAIRGLRGELERLRASLAVMTPPAVWGGNGYEVERSDEPFHPGFPWCVGVDGVGHYPIAWFATEADARGFVALHRAALSPPSEPDTRAGETR